MSIRRVLPLILVLGAFLVILLLLAVNAEAHTAEECDQLNQEMAEWFEYEQWHGTSFLALEDLRALLDEKVAWCSPQRADPTVSRSSGSYGGGVEQWRQLVAAYFSASDIETALCVIDRESRGGNPNARNSSSGASGLFQHLPKYWADRSSKAGWEGADIFNPEANVAVAAWLKRTGGWGHWTVINLCR